jgi:hypothetical protein
LNFNTFSIEINSKLKNALSLFLLLAFAMYHFGYYAFYISYDRHLESKWEEIIYSETSIEVEETLFEIPLSVPYLANQEEFKPTNTSFEKDGKFFRAIKQRYQNDTLQIIVVRDIDRGLLENSVKKWISFLAEDEIPQDQSSNVAVKFFAKDYIQPNLFSLGACLRINIDEAMGYVFLWHLNPVEGIESPPPQFS